MDRAFNRFKQRTVEAMGKGGVGSEGVADTTGDEKVERMVQLKEGLETVVRAGEGVMHNKRHVELEKRKIPYTKLGEALQCASGKVTDKAPLLKQCFDDTAKLQFELAQVMALYEQEMDTHFLQQTQTTIEKDLKYVISERKVMENLRLDRDAAKNRMVGAINGPTDKYVLAEASYNVSKEKFEEKQSQLAKTADDFWSKEENLANHLLEFCELQMRTFENAAKEASATVNYLRAALVTSNKVFRKPINEYTTERGINIPTIVEQCIAAIDAKGLEEEGIFRMSGNATSVRRLRQLFNSEDPNIDLTAPQWDGEHHAIAGVLKLYFRELPGSLLDANLYDNWMEVMRLPDHDAKMYGLQGVLAQLSTPRYTTLKSLIRFLCKVVAYTDQNKMQASNLGIVFGPTLLSRGEGADDGPLALVDSGALAMLVESLITYYSWLFTDDTDIMTVNYVHYTPVDKLYPLRPGTPLSDSISPSPVSIDIGFSEPSASASVLSTNANGRRHTHARSVSSTMEMRKRSGLKFDMGLGRRQTAELTFNPHDYGSHGIDESFQRVHSMEEIGNQPRLEPHQTPVAAPRRVMRSAELSATVPVPNTRPRVPLRPSQPAMSQHSSNDPT
eukprot:Ihof_evm4s229 gene=Ihof_evmTU4s229